MDFPKTDYSKIASKFDRVWHRRGADLDEDLAAIGEVKSPVFALDVGCGTGNYIRAQTDAQSCLVEWTGADPSEDMLTFARDKVPDARWIEGQAEDLQLTTDEFDFVYSSFAYHHFEDKDRAFDEIDRVLKPDGVVKFVNICPEYMQDATVYRFFDTTFDTDTKRHPSLNRLMNAFKVRGYEVEIRINVTYKTAPRYQVIESVETRDNSTLAILDDDLFDDGLQRIYDLEDDEVTDETAFLTLKARKRM